MSKTKITVSEPQSQFSQNQLEKINPYDAIVATLDGETMGRPRVQMLTTTRGENPAAHKPRQKKAA